MGARTPRTPRWLTRSNREGRTHQRSRHRLASFKVGPRSWRVSLIPSTRPARLPRATSGLRNRIWLPGVGAAVVLAALMAVVVNFGRRSRKRRATTVSDTLSSGDHARHAEHELGPQSPSSASSPRARRRQPRTGPVGSSTAAVGTVVPTTDGMGQLVFFWHNTRFVGWDAPDASMAIQALKPVGAGGFRVTYSNYTSNDPACVRRWYRSASCTGGAVAISQSAAARPRSGPFLLACASAAETQIDCLIGRD